MKSIFSAVIFLLISSSAALTQTSQKDSSADHFLSTVVVTADRFPNRILTSTTAVNYIPSAEALKYPVTSLSEIFYTVPGIIINDKSGLGYDPVISSRGYYGGGEAEYALLFIDGVQINDLETGLITWNFLDINTIENIEIVRGGSSALYGDAAIGGVVNITTKKHSKSFFAKAGSFDTYSAGLNFSTPVNDYLINFYLAGEKTGGFRQNSSRTGFNFGGNCFIDLRGNSYLKFSTNNQIQDLKKPGPFPEGIKGPSESYSLPLFKADKSDEKRFNFITEYLNASSWDGSIKLQIAYKYKNSVNTATFFNSVPVFDPLTFSPVGIYDTSLFGDTKKRELSVNEIRLSGNYYSDLQFLRFTVGSDANFGFYTSRHFSIFNGFEEDYSNSFSELNELVNDANGKRQDYAFYLNSELSPVERLKVNMGMRFDIIYDNYKSQLPDTSVTISNSALSPKAGLNFLFAEGKYYTGSIFANYNRAFKAPTVDQLMNLSSLDFGVFLPAGGSKPEFIPVKAAPFANPNLKPEKSTSFEAGSYNILKIFTHFTAAVSASVYTSDVTDEIDFDLSTFRYENIDKTRHRGFEGGLNLDYKGLITGFMNYTINEVKFRSGTNKDKLVKGVPGNVLAAGINFSGIFGFYFGLIVTSYSNTYLDDENTQKLNGFSTAGFRAGYKLGIVNLQLDIRNLLDKKYSSTGYLLNGQKFLFPSAGRTILGGISINFD